MRGRLAALAPDVARTASTEVMANIKLPELLEVYRVQIAQACHADVEAYFFCKVQAAYLALKHAHTQRPS